MEYINLHGHTEYTNLSTGFPDSMNKLHDYIDRAISLGYSGVAITEHECLTPAIPAEQYLDELISKADGEEKEKLKNFKLIRGNEIYLSRDDMSKESYKSGDKFYHFILLALDEIGYNQIRELSNRAWHRSFFRAVQRRWNIISDLEEVIGNNKGHVIGTTACLGGISGTYFLNGDMNNLTPTHDAIKSFLDMLKNIFGEDNFYIELAPATTSKDQILYNNAMYDWFKEEYRFLISTDAHYLKKEDFNVFKVFLNSKSSSDREAENFYSTAYLMNWEEIKECFNNNNFDMDFVEQCRINSIEIGNRCKDFRLKRPLTIPKVPMEDHIAALKCKPGEYEYIDKYCNSEYLEDRYLIYKVFENYDELIDKSKFSDEQICSRINEELTELWKISDILGQRLSSYLVTMAKMIDVIWEEADAIVGVSRGSAGAWVTNYLLGITQMNPLAYPIPIYPWRFIHHTRPDIMDVDFDTAGNKKELVIQALREYFESIGGSVTQVAAYKTEASRSALRTAARGLKIDDETALYATSLLAAKRGFFPSLNDAYNGTDEIEQVKEFKELMDTYPEWKEAAWKIEGLITGLSAHAAGIMVRNDKIEDQYSIMKTTKGLVVTSNDLHESEYAGLIKFDCLSVDALGKIRNCLNYLLQDGLIEWQGSLKKTYRKYLWPSELKYNDEFWENIRNNEINSLFQVNTQVGRQALANIKPTSIQEVGIINTLMRLQAQHKGDDIPVDVYKKYKNDIGLWYNEMASYGLSKEEVKILEEHLLGLSGVADSQESIMQLSMDPHIAGFGMVEANKLRKGVAKKSKKAQQEVKEMFYKMGGEIGTSKNMLDYVWNVQIGRQLGYSFSLPHVAGYSYIAMQEAELYTYYPHIYWNAAVLSADAGSDTEEDFKDLIEKGWMKKSIDKRQEEERLRAEFLEEFEDELEPDELEQEFQQYLKDYREDEEKKAQNARRGMIAGAVSNLQQEMNIAAPDINSSGYGFKPDNKHNAIICGLKIVAKCGNKLIGEIINNRPYSSLNDFTSRVKISKDRVCYLIKAGAFDNLESKPRLDILKDYVLEVSDQKKRLNLQNMQMLIKYNLLPDELNEQIKLFNWVKYVRKMKYDSEYYELDDRSYKYYCDHMNDNSISANNKIIVKQSEIENYYKYKMDTVRNYLSQHQDELLLKLNNILFEEEWNKYGVPTQADGEMESMRIYIHEHPLKNVNTSLKISSLEEMEMGETCGVFNIKGKIIPKMVIHHILCTVIDKDKMHHMVTILAPDGAREIKMSKDQFAFYDQALVDIVNGEKVIRQDSFFKTGTHILATGCIRGDMMMLKKYKDTPIDEVLMKVSLVDGNKVAAECKIGNRDEE